MVEVWLADPAQVADLAACEDVLDADELERARAFHFDRHRREYVVSHALVRHALSHHDGRPPRAWRFVRNRHGRPAAFDARELAFNLATHPTLVACAIARRDEIGVDVEPIARGAQILALAPCVFARGELAELAALDAGAARDRAVSLWTLKEAYIKARGLGLALGLDTFSIRFDPLAVEAHDGARWQLRTLDVAGHRIALAFAGSLHEVRTLWVR